MGKKKEKPEPDGKITYEVIQDAVNWHILKKLDEKFPIPSDFVIPSEKFHSMLLAELNNMRSGCTVIVAAPGMGKSTYLSFLYDRFKENGLPIIRHHYYLSERDGTIGRCNPENIAESLMNEIKVKYPESLGSLRFNNANFNDLSTWLAKSGEFFSKLEKALYVIIDGLDHVWQESQPTNGLERLFEHIFPTANGIVVIIGMQPISDEKIPRRLLQASPREKWLQLPPLDIKAMKQWVRNHTDTINLPDDTLQRNNILDMLAQDFHKKTGGFPLYLRFALNLIEHEKREINYNTVDDLPDFSQNGVLGYYTLLLQNLPEEQKQILYLLTVCSFPLKQNEIVECLEPKIALTTITNSIRKTKYLLKEDFAGLTLFHNSLRVFLQQQSDYPEYANMFRHLISNWVDNKAPEFLKQQYSWIMKAELGDNEPLILGPNRKWVIQAVAKLFPRTGISQVLSKSALAALENRNFARVIDVSFLLDYYNTIFEYWPVSLENLFYSQLTVNDDVHFSRSMVSDISLFTHKQLLLLSEHNIAEQELLKYCFNELDERQKGNRYDKYRRNYEQDESLLNSFIGSAALLDQDSFLQFANRLLNVKDPEISVAIEILCRALRKNKKSISLRKLLELPFSHKETNIILQYAILLSFEEKFDLSNEVLFNSKNPFAAIYASINELNDYSNGLIKLPSAVLFETLKDNPYSEEFNVKKTLYDTFFIFLANHLWQCSDRNDQWIEELPNVWLKQLIIIFNGATKELSESLRGKQQVKFDWLYKKVDVLRKPNWTKDHHLAVFGVYAENAIHQIVLDLFSIMNKIDDSKVTKPELENAFSTQYCIPWNLIDALNSHKSRLLSDEALDWCKAKLEIYLDSSINPFNERAIKYGQIANLLALHNHKKSCKNFVEKSSENLLAYGGHKDLTLSLTLDTIKLFYENKMSEAKEMLRRIIPAILSVKVYTDGDETKHLVRVLGDIISKYETDLLFSHYNWLVSHNESYNAQELINSIIENSDLSDPMNISLVKNNLDYKGLSLLRKRAKTDGSARDLLSSIGQPIDERSQLNNCDKTEEKSSALKYHDLPDPEEFPPEKFRDYMNLAKFNFYSKDIVEIWIRYWMNTPQKVLAYESLKSELERGMVFDAYDSLFELALTVAGKEEAYPWLVKAHIKRYGWNRFYSHDSATKRWSIIKQLYPTLWLQFIDDTLKPMFSKDRWMFVSAHIFEVLIEYFLFFDKGELAKVCGIQAVRSVQELVSPMILPKPTWLSEEQQNKSSKSVFYS